MHDATKTVRDFAVELPQAARLFERLGIDYCCGGGKPLQEACAQAQISVDDVLRELKEGEKQTSATFDWSKASLSALIDHIVATHHGYVKQELPRLEQLLNKVAGKHGGNHPELNEMKEIFLGLRDELTSHLMKEETILFPYIRSLESSAHGSGRVQSSCFGSVKNPIHMMELEHDSAGDALRQLREMTNGYVPPVDTCTSFKTLYQGLQEFEADLHQHIHLENNILHPRAIELEARTSR